MTTLLTANELRSKTAFPVSTQYGLGNCRAQDSHSRSFVYVRTVSRDSNLPEITFKVTDITCACKSCETETMKF